MWDTAGQERFRTITQSYYRSANGVILAYDITKKETLANIHRWVDDVHKYAGTGIVQLLIGEYMNESSTKRDNPFLGVKNCYYS